MLKCARVKSKACQSHEGEILHPSPKWNGKKTILTNYTVYYKYNYEEIILIAFKEVLNAKV